MAREDSYSKSKPKLSFSCLVMILTMIPTIVLAMILTMILGLDSRNLLWYFRSVLFRYLNQTTDDWH